MHMLGYRILAAAGAAAALVACSNNNNSNSGDASTDAAVDAAVDASLDATTDASSDAADAAHAADAADAGDAALDAQTDAGDAQVLSDGQIVGVVETGSLGEIAEALLAVGTPDGGTFDAGPLDAGPFDGGATDGGFDAAVFDGGFDAGAARSTSPNVTGFANMMITEHSRLFDAVASLGIAPAASTAQATLEQTTTTTIHQLSPLSMSAFDMAYVQSQITSHTVMRDLITSELIPAAQDAKLKAFLSSELLPAIETHLAEANVLMSQLGDGGADAATDAAGE